MLLNKKAKSNNKKCDNNYVVQLVGAVEYDNCHFADG